MTGKKRYIFVSYEDLLEVNFNKLEKVASKVVIFIDKSVEQVPFRLVKRTQDLGKRIKWIQSTPDAVMGFEYHIVYMIGKLDEKTESEVEFAIISNRNTFDSFINYLNKRGRSCLRVELGMKDKSQTTNTTQEPNSSINHLSLKEKNEVAQIQEEEEDTSPFDVIRFAAQNTVQKLVASGNRPSNISMLKSYIILNNQEEEVVDNIEDVLAYLEENQDIYINESEVSYNF